MAIATEISDLLPLYLSGKIALRDALTFATATATPPSTKGLLSTLLKESKSLPRTTDTDPTSPTPDRPSPAQERLLDFARGVHEILRRRQGSEIGYGIELDADEGSFAGNNTEEEEYELVKSVVVSSFPVASTTSLSLSLDRGEPSIFGNEHGYEPGYGYEERTHLEQRTSPPFDSFDSSDFASGSAPAPAPAPTRTTSHTQTQTQTQRRRRRSSAKQGTQKPFYNLISFLAFLTKERLLLSAGTGERIALEMARDTLSHLHPHIPLPLHAHSQKPEEEGGEKRWFGVGVGDGDGGEASVTAVALWMIIMGEELFARIESYYHDNYCSSGSGRNKNKTTSEGSDGGCRWRAEWETWTSRLQFLSLCEDLGVSAREQAAEAAAVMRRV